MTDTIPVQICMTGSQTGWTSIAVTFGTQAGPLPGVTLSVDQTFYASASTPDCRNLEIDIATGPLSLDDPNVALNFNGNFSLSDANPVPSTGSERPQVSFEDVKISISRWR